MAVDLFQDDVKVKGGVCGSYLLITHTKNITTWPESKDLVQLGPIVLMDDVEWLKVSFIRKSLSPQENTLVNGSKVFLQSLPGLINNIDSDKRVKLLDLEDEPLVIIFTDKNKNRYVIGSPEHPASLLITNRNVGNTTGSGNKMAFIATSASVTPYLTASN